MIKIKRCDTGEIIHSGDFKTIKECLEDSIRNGISCYRAYLIGADLSNADLSNADLSDANLSNAYLRGADLSDANLSNANLSNAYLIGADLSDANLSNANLSNAYLIGADLSGANLSNADLISQIDFMNANFEKNNSGYIVYKAIGDVTPYCISARWEIKENSIIEETVNPLRTNDCGCGINVGTKKWITTKYDDGYDLWECLIEWEWLTGVVVPYSSDGKIRTEKLRLLRQVEK